MKQTIKQRLIEYINYKRIGQGRFEKSVGFSNGYINNIKGSFGADKLEKIFGAYPDLDKDWLLTGKGNMLKDGNQLQSGMSDNHKSHIAGLLDTIGKQENLIKRQNEELEARSVSDSEFISYLKSQIDELKQDNEDLRIKNERLTDQNGYYKGLLDNNGISYKQTAS